MKTTSLKSIESVYYIYGVIIGLTYIFIWVHVRSDYLYKEAIQLFFKHVICALEVLNALYTIYVESVYYLIYIWVYMQIFYKGFIILLLTLVYIYLYILMLGLKYSFNEIYS